MRSQFLDHPAVNVAGPIQASLPAERLVGPHKSNAGIVNEYEAEVRRDGWRKAERLADTHVIGHPLQALKEAHLHPSHEADQHDGANGNQDGNALDERPLHWHGV